MHKDDNKGTLVASAPRLTSLDAVRQLSGDALVSLQLERLRQTLTHVYTNSPVYKAKFDAAGVSPNDLTDLSDLSKFPFTTKDDLREQIGRAHV